MTYTTTNIKETIKTIQNIKNTDNTTLTLWFENDYIIEINKKDQKAILYEFEPNTEHYHYQGEYKTLIEDLQKGHIKYGKKHKYLGMDVN
ncbi:hypothetical protein PXD04_11285 (plasmid) [Methanosphaera sp. ISO3-F5]|uniref:hypothetical protein n=1 Tax=Methanosphaera sp. ISO3-F5 TaxID=1452353 RepID=UPI002B25FB8D|nr:hypothetical protein [Methanosphaera sp. ISO3-F5]WQH65457.1 hypothetical protein PXD04_11285 [Methanosphaera sp. ISO3-F5]